MMTVTIKQMKTNLNFHYI